ncbi:MAG TPA: flavin reductase family protein [Pseudomonadales bacterium]|nr:flavin reductase family protein [Pseudomonadales bacterium]
MTLFETPSIALRAGMRRLAASVCVITAVDNNGQRHAMTATAVTSVSDDPASLLVCVNRHTSLHDILAQGQRFAVNVLSANQADISVQCASGESGEARFALGHWGDANNLPYLRDAQAVFLCRTARQLSHGTHTIVIGDIDKVMVAENDVDPLLYADGKYRKLEKQPI